MIKVLNRQLSEKVDEQQVYEDLWTQLISRKMQTKQIYHEIKALPGEKAFIYNKCVCVCVVFI